jgi:hypothetical protein
MPLLDHFKQPLATERPWDGFLSSWACTMTTLLNLHHLPADYFAIPQTVLGGGMRIPPLPPTVDGLDQDLFEVQIYQQLGGPQLRAVVELASPTNKDRPGRRRAFAVKCAAYLQRGVSIIIIDIVTEPPANLHMEMLKVLELRKEVSWSSPTHLYAVTYRTAVPAGQQQLEIWTEPLQLGAELPALPLWLSSELALPLRLEESYAATCAGLRIPL